MSIADILTAIEQSYFANWIGGNVDGAEFVFPIVETLHVISIATVFGSIFMVDMRLLGLVARNNPAARFVEEYLPWTWTAFASAVVTGMLMFVAHATTYWENTQFRFKFVLMFLAGCNMLIFHTGAHRQIAQWSQQLPPPRAARVAGFLSIALWFGVVVLGRWVGFTT